MREEYDFSKAVKNPYIRPEKTTVTIRLDKTTVEYFKGISEEINIPYQTLINAYLADCVAQGKKPAFIWSGK